MKMIFALYQTIHWTGSLSVLLVETTVWSRHAASLGHIILIPSQPVVALTP